MAVSSIIPEIQFAGGFLFSGENPLLTPWADLLYNCHQVKPRKVKAKMNYAEAESLLKKCGQQQVLAHWPKLGKKDRESLLAQIATLDPKSLARCQKALAEGAVPPDGAVATLLTLTGSVMEERAVRSDREVLDLSGRPSGVYLLRLSSGGETHTWKVIKGE